MERPQSLAALSTGTVPGQAPKPNRSYSNQLSAGRRRSTLVSRVHRLAELLGISARTPPPAAACLLLEDSFRCTRRPQDVRAELQLGKERLSWNWSDSHRRRAGSNHR